MYFLLKYTVPFLGDMLVFRGVDEIFFFCWGGLVLVREKATPKKIGRKMLGW